MIATKQYRELPPAARPQVDLEAQHSGLGVDDVLYAIFKHKWKILLCTIAGLIAAAAFILLTPPIYESQAKLLVRYVLERSSVDPVEGSSGSGQTTDTVISSEVEILTSWDLAVQVAEAIGPKRLLPGAPTGATAAEAAATVRDGLTVSARPHSNIIFVAYRNSRPELAALVLEELVTRYFTKHLEVHRSAGAFDFVTQQTDQVRSRLTQTEDAIRAIKAKLGIISLSDSNEALSGELAKIQDQLHASEAEQMEQETRVKQMEQMTSVGKSEAKEDQKEIPSSGNVQHYQALVARLAQLRGTEMELLSKYTPGNVVVKMTRAQITDLENQRRELETQFPELPATLGSGSSQGQGQSGNLATEQGRLNGMKARSEMLRTRLRNVRDEIKQLSDVTPQIADLERNKELEEANYKYFEATLQKARVDEALDPSKMPNISAVQKPTPPMKVISRRNKISAELAGGGLALGLALALLNELVLSRTVKRPIELERRLGASVLMSIPYSNGSRKRRVSLPPTNGNKPAGADMDTEGTMIAPWEPGHFIRRYSEAIRDRLGLYFELNQMTHKPKLVGVTGFSDGAGTSTLAAGLAASLSEMGEGKVLLVDVNLEHAAVHPFFAGRPASTLTAALEAKGPIPPAADNLYLATVASPNAAPMQRALKRFFNLMPNLKESDFDYIIFDLPPLTDTNPTLGMAAYMDKLLLVVEAGANNRETVKRGYAELIASRANVSVVFNKAHSYIPKWLDGGA